ncbi:hypothetical protein S7711_09908 [Stachybotrys chartarum IBT 7711]|uniref:NAD-dependent epimerase/dehydratase domain-containing protein n=1 Tax=Stachybotrys chartarum (strain CBS 109288 / IBT 7711) TaxID=1280523 RepID=A0A084AEW7_STACB|nr:hypothetical protein S7711_09908 [Stachybotrys chartarum IBT 7711]
MTTSSETTAVIPTGSLILVVGVNAYLGCRFANTLIERGYRVRGVVRDTLRCSHIDVFFREKHGPNVPFEMVQVPDYTAQGAFDQVVQGCAGLILFAADNSFAPDPEIVVKGSVTMTVRALEAAATESCLKRFVLTSSYVTACLYRMGEVYEIGQDTWNTEYPIKAWAPPPYTPERSLYTYGTAKVESEQAMWNFVKDKKPSFVANAVLPDFVTGASMPHAKPSVGPMSFALEALWQGGEAWKFLGPQWMIDAEDASLLHLGALLHPNYQGERIFGCAHLKRWTDWIVRLRAMYPTHKFPGTATLLLMTSEPTDWIHPCVDPPESEAENLEIILDQSRAEALLKWFGKDGFRPMEESMKEVFDTMV